MAKFKARHRYRSPVFLFRECEKDVKRSICALLERHGVAWVGLDCLHPLSLLSHQAKAERRMLLNGQPSPVPFCCCGTIGPVHPFPLQTFPCCTAAVLLLASSTPPMHSLDNVAIIAKGAISWRQISHCIVALFGLVDRHYCSRRSLEIVMDGSCRSSTVSPFERLRLGVLSACSVSSQRAVSLFKQPH